MAFAHLSMTEQHIVQQCIVAISEGPFIDDCEFRTRLGLGRPELRAIRADWPNLDDSDPQSRVSRAINNCMVEILYGVPITPDEWHKWIGMPKQEVENVFSHWRELQDDPWTEGEE